MVNKEDKLTVDDLIVEYMIVKIQLGYEPSYTTREFISFINYFQQFMNVHDVIYEDDKLFDRFFERKKQDWSVKLVGSRYIGSCYQCEDKVFIPHIERRGDILIATNRLSAYDESIININYMTLEKQEEIRSKIESFLEYFDKRKINMNVLVSDNEMNLGEVVSALFVNSIWEQYVREKIKYQQWPSQCKDIDEYLLNMDLAKIIKLPSIRDELLSFYKDIAKRVAVLLHNNSELRIKNYNNPYLPYSNYLCIMNGYDNLLKLCTSCSYDVSLMDNVFVSNADKMDKYSNSVITKLDDENTKRLVRTLNRSVYGE